MLLRAVCGEARRLGQPILAGPGTPGHTGGQHVTISGTEAHLLKYTFLLAAQPTTLIEIFILEAKVLLMFVKTFIVDVFEDEFTFPGPDAGIFL